MTECGVGLNVLIVARSLPFHNLGGMEAVAWDLARALAREGNTVTLLTTACDRLPSVQIKENVRIHPLDVPTGRYSRAWWRQSTYVFNQQYKHNVDIVLSVSAGARAIMKSRPSDGSGPRFVVQAHGTAWGEFLSKMRQRSPIAWLKASRNLISMVEDIAYRRADACVAVGAVVQADLQRRPSSWLIGGVPVHLINNGVDTDAFAFSAKLRRVLRSSLSIPETAGVVFSASRLHPQKGVEEAIKGFELAATEYSNLHYVIAGSGPDEQRLRDYASHISSASRIHFIGNVARDDLKGWYSAADVFLFTTTRAEVGLTLNVLEARAAGLPTVVSRHIDRPGFGAIPVDVSDAECIASAILAGLKSASNERGNLLPENHWLSYSTRQYMRLFRELKNGF